MSPRPIDFLLLWLWASGTDEGHPRANAIYAKERPGSGMAPGLLLENNLASPTLNQTRNTYGLVGMPYSESPWLMGGKGLIGLENFFSPSFPKPSLLQEYKRHKMQIYTASEYASLLRKRALPAIATLNSPTLRACQAQGATLTQGLHRRTPLAQ